MTQTQLITDSRKGKHLSLQERTIIQEKHRDGWSNRQIATYIERVPQTVNNEIKRGTTTQRRKQTQNDKAYLYCRTLHYTNRIRPKNS